MVKPGSIVEPKTYLGAGISKAFYPDGSYAWLMSSNDYVREALQNIKKDLTRNDLQFNKKVSDPNYSAMTPFCSIDYKLELDTTALCNDELTNNSQNLIFLFLYGLLILAELVLLSKSHLYQNFVYIHTLTIYIKHCISSNILKHTLITIFYFI